MKSQKNVSLLFCIVMDLIGYATYAVPVLGELGDIFWAPVSAIIFFIAIWWMERRDGWCLQLCRRADAGSWILFLRLR